MVPLINGIARSWAEINVPFLGQPLSGVVSISWEENSNVTMNPGIGKYASSYGEGNYTFTGSMTFTQEEWNNIVSVSPNNKPTQLGIFDLPLLYLNDSNGFVMKTLWKSSKITSVKIAPNQGDTMIPVEVQFIMADIQTTIA